MQAPEIPGYRIVRKLGSGGMATVYLAVQESLQREVALKVMTPGLAVDKVACHRFVKEGKFIAKLGHPNLISVFDTGILEAQGDDGDEFYYMACEYLPGGTVQDKLQEGIKEEDAVTIIREAAAGLAYTHEQGIVHRDLKPDNLLFRADGTCVLGDFGIAKSVNSNTASTKMGTSVGTPHYMSPEQAKGEKVDHRSDIYALGVVFYELLVGKPPFEGNDPFSIALAQIQEPLPELPKNRKRYQTLITKLTEKDRQQRYQTVAEFLADLEKLVGKKKTHPKPRAQAKRPAQPGTSRPGKGKAKAKARKKQRVPRPAGGSRAPVRIALAILVITAAVTGAWYLQTRHQLFGELPTLPTTSRTAPSDEPDAGGEVAELLSRADEYLDEGDYFAPRDENAYEAYQGVLHLDVTNEAAQQGLQDLLAAVAGRARELWEAGAEDEARNLVREGLRRFPADPELTALRSEMGREAQTSAATPAIGDSDVERALARADRLFQQGSYDDATRLYQQVLSVDAQNETASRKLSEIAGIWRNAAQSYMQQGQLDVAAGMIRKGLNTMPGDPRLEALRERLETMRAEQQDGGGQP